ncbi:hypothetical protein [Cupriavidus necator]|uniref:hypothetical protein n=1 Tax=Cupriavidus necator TaxID=106590 RepID=UPI00339D776E
MRIVYDDAGKADIAALLSSVAETEFEKQGVARILGNPRAVENWRVGEAIAESFVIAHRGGLFPWPDGRDERKEGSSLPGADLVGFRGAANEARFAFGEVKTSGENVHPPGAMHGRTGLKQQLEDLRDNTTIRDGLVAYLGYRAVTSSWQGHYKSATRRYLANPSQVYVFGVLIRDVTPHQDDLRVRITKLSVGRPDGTEIELFAIYLPNGSIAQLGAKALAARTKIRGQQEKGGGE